MKINISTFTTEGGGAKIVAQKNKETIRDLLKIVNALEIGRKNISLGENYENAFKKTLEESKKIKEEMVKWGIWNNEYERLIGENVEYGQEYNNAKYKLKKNG